MKKVNVFTDGSCSVNTREGGYGALMECEGHKLIIFGGQENTTNNRMELQAVISSLEALDEKCKVTITSDSKYVLDGLKSRLNNWRHNGWKTRQGKPVQNQDLWERLYNARKGHRLTLNWVKGHDGHEENELADYFATRHG